MENLKRVETGIIYLAFGYEYLLMAVHSAKTAKKTNPGIFCELVTNMPFDNLKVGDYSPFDSVKILEYESKYNRLIKTNIIKYASFKRGAYFDCDTEIRGSLDPIFRCLDRYDVAIKLNPKPTFKDYEIAPGIPGQFFPFWAGGIVFFRTNDNAKALFERWFKIFQESGKSVDQPALARAIYDSPEVKLLTLNAVWNTFLGDEVINVKNKRLSNESKNWLKNSRIWHYRKPEEWPYVAPDIYDVHQHLFDSMINPNSSVLMEIDDVSRRYKILSSPLYRYVYNRPILKKILIIILDIPVKLGIRQGIKLSRDKQLSGENYKLNQTNNL
jgi:hypothetical protein